MNKTITTAIGGIALLSLAVPAAAQQSTTQNSSRDIFGRIITAILGPDQAKPTTPDQAAADASLQQVLAAPRRSTDAARDQWRHPAQTLDFFRVAPGMTVVDYMPGSGWYTRILAPYLGATGTYVGITPDPAAVDAEKNRDYYARMPNDFRTQALQWGLAGAPVAIYASQDVPAELKGKVDRVLIFREIHNLLRSGALYSELTRLRDLLKPDGLVGVVQHRAKENAPADYTLGTNGYLRQSDVIALFRAHGFELVDSSEINANPRDPANHVGGVWQLPPTLSGKNEALRSIGESDRMTLLFRKRS